MKELYHYNNKVYVILRRIPHHNFHKKNGELVLEVVGLWRDHLGADHVLKDQTHFIFCHTVQDVEWEEIPA
jgi:hypothetical protein